MKTKEMQSKYIANIAKIVGCKENDIRIGIYENSSMVQWGLEEFFNHYNPEDIAKGQCSLVFKVDMAGSTIISFQLKDMYNCCGIIVGSDLFISKSLRGKGLGTISTEFMIEFAKYYGYGVLQGSDRKDNEPQTKIFEKLGWTKSCEFHNLRTGNDLIIWLFNMSKNEH